MRNKNVIMGWYKKLRDTYGAPQGQWTLWCKRPKTDEEREQVMIEAILTQRTNWRNVERVRAVLGKRRLLRLGAFLNAYRKNPAGAALLIKSSGFYQQKAERLAGLAAFIKKQYGTITAMKRAPVSTAGSGKRRDGPASLASPRSGQSRQDESPACLRAELLSLKGIGPETADSILLYAFDKLIFVIDEYTRRFLTEKFLNARNPKENRFYNRSALKMTYEELQNYFQNNLKKDFRLYQDFHALIVIDGKEHASA